MQIQNKNPFINTSSPVPKAVVAKNAKNQSFQKNDGFRRAPSHSQMSKALRGAKGNVDPNSTEGQVQSLFKKQFAEKAGDQKEFHAFMKEVFGDNYNFMKAEAYRQSALVGDFSWLPPVQFVSDSELGGANGAYSAETGVVYINEKLKDNIPLAAQTFVEEAGHHLDAKLNTSDTVGDEGEMFRRLMGNEKLSAAQIKDIKTENDKGTIVVDGKKIEVEFWNPFKAIGKAISGAAKAVGKAISGAAKAVGKAVVGVAKGIGAVVKGVAGGVKSFVTGIGEGVGGFVSNVFKGNFGKAWDSLVRGADKAFIQAPTRVFNGVLNGVETAAKGLLKLTGPFAKPLERVFDHFWDPARSIVTGVWDAGTSLVRNVVEGGTDVLKGIGKVFTGDFSGGFSDMGMGLWKATGQNVVDAALLLGGRAISAVQTLIGVEPPGRKLTDSEIATLREVYGDSIDYDAIRIKEGDAGLFSLNDRPFTHGNTVYMKDRTITDELLIHEMAHVWQHQNGGSDYMSEALWSQEYGHGYKWKESVPGTPWEDLEPEQQAELLEEAYEYGYFTPSDSNYGKYVARIDGVDVDLTAYMNDVKSKLRNGEGAS